MQTLWSRIAQTRISCHCPSCVSATHGVARRATTTTGRRPVKLAVSSTFVYSGIFAAAATTDAGIKQKRRDQWDRAIADIRQDLEEPAEEQLAKGKEEKLEETTRYTPITEETVEALLETASRARRGPIWPTNTGMPLNTNYLAPQSIYATDRLRRKAANYRWTPKKLRMNELAIDKLILRMLLHLEDHDMRLNLESAVPESCHSFFFAPKSEMNALLVYTNLQHIVASRLDPYSTLDQFPRQHQYGVTYIQDDMGEFHHTAVHLDASFQQLFQKRKSGHLSHSELIAKICYNLSVSTAAPNVDCWNTLLAGLLDNDQDAIVIPPLIMAIRNSNLRMNETTMRSILKYHIATDNSTRFGRFVDQMRGLFGGLSLAKHGINITDAGRSRLVRDEETGKVFQKPYPTPGVFEVLIQGVLHFVGFDAALRVCQDMGSQGWGLSIRGLTPLLDDRARNADWDAGCEVWDQIKRLQAESRSRGQPERLFPQTYSAMLRLCNACNETARFDEILREALAARHPQRMLLDLFKQEGQPRPARAIMQPTAWRNIASSVSEEDLSKVVQRIYGNTMGLPNMKDGAQSMAEEVDELNAEPLKTYEVDC